MAKFLIGTLLFIRVLAVLYAGPVFSAMGVEGSVRVFLSAVVAVAMTSVYGGAQPPLSIDAWALAFIAIKEVLVGSLIGYTASLIVTAARFAGGIIDFEIGFQTALLFDVNAGAPTLIGEIKALMITMLMLIMNGHHFILEAVFASTKLVPIDSFAAGDNVMWLLVRFVTGAMIIGVKIASPVLVALFLTNLALALMARVAPQLNIFVLSMHVKILVGLLSLMATVPLVMLLMKHSLGIFQDELMKLLMAISVSGG